MRRRMAQHERRRLTLADGEVRDRRETLATHRYARLEDHHVGPGDRAEPAVVRACHPRHGDAVVEAERQLHAHRYPPMHPPDDAYDVRGDAAYRHELDRGHRAFGRLERG